MKKVFKVILGLTFVFTFFNLGHSAEVGDTGANFLKIGVSSRAIGMGGAHVGLADDAYAIFWNPGGLGNVKYNEITTMYNKYLEGISHGFTAFVYPTRYAGVYGLSIIYLTSGSIKETKVNSTGGYEYTNNTFNTFEYCVMSSYGYRFNRRVSAGGNFKLIKGRLANYSSDLAFALDLGAIYSPWRILNLGLSVQNMGTPVRYDKKDFKLPFVVRLGTALKLLDESLILALDVNIPNDNNVNIHAGMEYNLLEVFSFRTGYQTGDKDDLWSYSLGFGVKLKGLYFDYAFKPTEDFGNTHRISMGWKFGGVMDEDEVIDYNGMRKKEEYIEKRKEEKKFKPRERLEIEEKDLDFYKQRDKEEHKPKKMQKRRLKEDEDRYIEKKERHQKPPKYSPKKYYDHEYEEDELYNFLEEELD